jgi:UDPglucose--hexose-1-phosphate uridylyltransferase
MLKEELSQRIRIIYENDHFAAFAPYASKSPYECRILPKKHHCALGDIEEGEIEDFARVLRIILKKLYVGLNNPDYNFIIRSAPTDDVDIKHYHWYVVVIPKISTPAGFEIGSGIFINIIPPEDAADYLRSIDVET